MTSGEVGYAKVREANQLVRRIVYLHLGLIRIISFPDYRCEYLKQKGVDWVIEQPTSSVLWYYPPMEEH